MRLVQALDVDAELLLFGNIPDREKRDNTRIQFLMQGLKESDKEILLQTMGTLAENLQKYR